MSNNNKIEIKIKQIYDWFPDRELSVEECFKEIENSDLPASKDLPASLIKYFKKVVQEDSSNRLRNKLRSNPRRIVQITNSIIKQASEITKVDPEVLIRLMDLDLNDLTITKFQASIAELRAIIHLASEGFKNIKLLQAEKGSKRPKSADLIAELNGIKYALDVASISAESKQDVERLGSKMKDIADSKRQQLEATKIKYNCERTGVVIAINHPDFLLSGDRDVYSQIVKKTIEDLQQAYGDELPEKFHISILTNMQVFGDEPYEVVYPPWGE